jgi:hypothetical protein
MSHHKQHNAVSKPDRPAGSILKQLVCCWHSDADIIVILYHLDEICFPNLIQVYMGIAVNAKNIVAERGNCLFR